MAIRNGAGYTFDSTNGQSTISVDKEFSDYYEGSSFTCSPYKVHYVVEVTVGLSSYVKYQICPGTFNNQMPQVYDSVNEVWKYLNALAVDTELVLEFDSTTSSFIYLRVGPSTGGNFPPTVPSPTDPYDPYPRVYSTGSAIPSDTDTFGYVLLAKVTNTAGVYSIEQYVTGSLWGDRIKLGTITASYYYARI
jgi:hypothetical protein